MVQQEKRKIFAFTVDGVPVAQGRPRFAAAGGHVIAYDPPKSKDYKRLIGYLAKRHAPIEPVLGPVRFSLKIFLPIPKSCSKEKHRQAEQGIIRPTKKPDVSNILKGVEDALKGIFYKDDSQIVEYGVIGKWYSDKPRIEVAMEVLNSGKS